MTTTYYERNGKLYKLVVDSNVLDYVWDGSAWSSANDALTGWLVNGDDELTPVDQSQAEKETAIS